MSAKTILYVEDNELNRKLVRHLLRHVGGDLVGRPGVGAYPQARQRSQAGLDVANTPDGEAVDDPLDAFTVCAHRG